MMTTVVSFSLGTVWLCGAKDKKNNVHTRCSAISKPRTQGTQSSLINYIQLHIIRN